MRDINRALFFAIKNQNQVEVQSIIEQGCDLNFADSNGDTALIYNSKQDENTKGGFFSQINIADLLLNNGANINMQNISGASALMHASFIGNRNLVEYLLQKGANIDDQSKNGKTALVHAIIKEKDNTSTIEILLNSGANLNIPDIHGYTPLMHLVMVRHYDALIQKFIDNGADVSLKQKDGIDAFLVSAESGSKNSIEILLKNGANLNSKCKKDMGALHYAANSDSDDSKSKIYLLLRNGLDLNSKDIYGETPLMNASCYDDNEISMLLVQNGAEINAVDINGKTAIIHCLENCSENTLETLINLGADLSFDNIIVALEYGCEIVIKKIIEKKIPFNRENEMDASLMFSAAKAGMNEVVIQELDRGVDIEAKNKHNSTVLRRAVIDGNARLVRTLISRGADIKALYNDDNLPDSLSLAIRYGHTEVVRELARSKTHTNITRKTSAFLLNEASLKNHIEIARILIEDGVVEGTKCYADSLVTAAKSGFNDFILLLLQRGGDVNSMNHNNETSLLAATKAGLMDTVILLIRNGASMNATDEEGCDALMLAAKFGHKYIAELLIDNRIAINTKNKIDQSAISLSIMNRKFEILKLLIREGSDIHHLNSNDTNALMLASRYGCYEEVKLLLDNDADLNATNTKGWTALMFAIASGHSITAKILLDAGSYADIETSCGATPLILSLEKGYTDLSIMLINRISNIDFSHKKCGSSYLMYASQYNNKKAAKLLLEKGAKINIKNKNGYTALTFATIYGDNEIVQLLIKHGSSIQGITESGETLLMTASKNKSKFSGTIIAKSLISKVDIHARNLHGKTAMMFAAENGNSYFVELLLSHEDYVDNIDNHNTSVLMFAAQNGDKATLDIILDKKPTINDVNSHGYTALMFASENGHATIVKELIIMSTNINLKNKDGMTPLMLAASRGHFEVTKILINSRAEISLKNHNNKDALMLAAINGHKEIVSMLLDNGSDIHANDNHNLTALMLLEQNAKHVETAILLIMRGANLPDDKSRIIATLENASWWTDNHTAVINNNLDQIQSFEDILLDITPLDLAIMIGNIEMVKAIIEFGFKHDIHSCLRTAIIAHRNELVELFLKKGADPTIKDRFGKNSLHIGCFYGNVGVILLIAEFIRKKIAAKSIQIPFRYHLFHKRKRENLDRIRENTPVQKPHNLY